MAGIVENEEKRRKELAIGNVIASMEASGFTLTEEDIARVRGIAEGTLDGKEEKAKLLKKHRELAKTKRTHRLS